MTSLDPLDAPRNRLMPAHHLDSRIGPFLLLVDRVRSQMHTLRRSVKALEPLELRASVLTLNEVLEMYTWHLKYLRKHTLTAFISFTSVADQIKLISKPLMVFLDLNIGLRDKELSITLDHCPSLTEVELSTILSNAQQSLKLMDECLFWLRSSFRLVGSALKENVDQRSLLMVRQLSDVISNVSFSRYTFNLGIRGSKARILHQSNLRHLRLREHEAVVVRAFHTLGNIHLSNGIHEC